MCEMTELVTFLEEEFNKEKSTKRKMFLKEELLSAAYDVMLDRADKMNTSIHKMGQLLDDTAEYKEMCCNARGK